MVSGGDWQDRWRALWGYAPQDAAPAPTTARQAAAPVGRPKRPRRAPARAEQRPRRDLKGHPLEAPTRDLPPGRAGNRRPRRASGAGQSNPSPPLPPDPAAAARAALHEEATRAKKQTLLDAYARIGNITQAAQVAGIERRLHYDWIDQDADYRARFADKCLEARDRVDGEIARRGIVGIEEPLVYAGRPVMIDDMTGPPGPDGRRPQKMLTRRVYSDLLLIFYAKGLNPEKYRDNYRVEHTGAGGGPVEHEHRVTFYLPANPRAAAQVQRALPPAERAAR